MASGLHEAENFDSKLARVILDWLAQIRQSDLQLPVDTGDFFSNYGQEVLLATLCVLQQHSQVVSAKDVHYTGGKRARTGSTRRLFVPRVAAIRDSDLQERFQGNFSFYRFFIYK
jgi:hypothetical protein